MKLNVCTFTIEFEWSTYFEAYAYFHHWISDCSDSNTLYGLQLEYWSTTKKTHLLFYDCDSSGTINKN